MNLSYLIRTHTIIIRADCVLQEFASELQKVFGKEGEKLKEVKLSVSVHQYSASFVIFL